VRRLSSAQRQGEPKRKFRAEVMGGALTLDQKIELLLEEIIRSHQLGCWIAKSVGTFCSAQVNGPFANPVSSEERNVYICVKLHI
jgi:hypothetical protein